MKTDTPGFLDVKLTVVTKDPAPWLEGLGAMGETEAEEQKGAEAAYQAVEHLFAPTTKGSGISASRSRTYYGIRSS